MGCMGPLSKGSQRRGGFIPSTWSYHYGDTYGDTSGTMETALTERGGLQGRADKRLRVDGGDQASGLQGGKFKTPVRHPNAEAVYTTGVWGRGSGWRLNSHIPSSL